MSTRPETTQTSRTEFENKELRTERLHFEHAIVEFEVGPVGVYAKIRDGGAIEYAGPLDDETIESLYDAGERDVWVDKDPHNLLPENFKREYDSLLQASRSQVSSTDARTEPRCPMCTSTNISKKAGTKFSDPEQKRSEDYRCRNNNKCGGHFDDPAPSVEDEDVPRHETCGRAVHVRRIGHGRFKCHRCDEIFSKPEADE